MESLSRLLSGSQSCCGTGVLVALVLWIKDTALYSSSRKAMHIGIQVVVEATLIRTLLPSSEKPAFARIG